MIDIRVGLFAPDMSAVENLEHRCLCSSYKDQEQAFLTVRFRQVLVNDLALLFSRPATPNGNPVRRCPATESAMKAPRHSHQMSIIEITLSSMELTPPNAKATRIL
ncbi:MAG: hypothetical protein ACJ746_18630, partial [Bryobacteraceae bacterium]